MEPFNNDTMVGDYEEIPLYITYLKMTMLLLAPFVVAVPTGLVLRVIAVEEKFHNKYYFLVANLLATDLLAIVGENLVRFVALLTYVSGIQVQINCVFLSLFEIPASTSQLLFITLAIDRLVVIAYPYRHRTIMTNKFVCCKGMGSDNCS